MFFFPIGFRLCRLEFHYIKLLHVFRRNNVLGPLVFYSKTKQQNNGSCIKVLASCPVPGYIQYPWPVNMLLLNSECYRHNKYFPVSLWVLTMETSEQQLDSLKRLFILLVAGKNLLREAASSSSFFFFFLVDNKTIFE